MQQKTMLQRDSSFWIFYAYIEKKYDSYVSKYNRIWKFNMEYYNS